MDVFLLWHVREDDIYREDAKLIGVYSSEEEARRAIERVKDQPGFRDWPQGFEYEPHRLGRDHWTEGYVTVVPGEG